MRFLRGLGAALAWLLASILMLLAVVLGLTIVLLPVSVLLGFAALRLFKLRLKLAMPRAGDIKRAARKETRRWRRTAKRKAERAMGRVVG